VWVIDQIVFSKESKLKTLAMSARHKLPKFIYVLLQHLAKAERSEHEKTTFWGRLSFSRLMFILGVYFVVFNFFAAVESQKYDWSESFQSRFERYRFQ
jgi:hypothetical protein